MAAVTRILRRDSAADPIEAEAAARSAARRAAAAVKEQEHVAREEEGTSVSIEWGKSGVHTAFDELFEVNTASPPAPPRRAQPDAPPKPSPKPVAETKVRVASGGWAPTAMTPTMAPAAGMGSTTPAATVAKALAEMNLAPYPVAPSLEQAVAHLAEALTEERKRTAAAEERADRLQAEADKAREQLVGQWEIFARVMEQYCNK